MGEPTEGLEGRTCTVLIQRTADANGKKHVYWAACGNPAVRRISHATSVCENHNKPAEQAMKKGA